MKQTNRLASRIILPFLAAALILVVLFLMITNYLLSLIVEPAVGDTVFASFQWMMIGQSMLMAVFLVAVMLLLVHRHFLRPFNKLLRLTGELAKENVNLEIAVDANDGLGSFSGIYKAIEHRLRTLEEKIATASQNLRDSELKFKSITSSTLDGIMMVNNDGRVTYWNEAAERIFGYSTDEIMHQELRQLLIPERFHKEFQDNFPDIKHNTRGGIFGRQMEVIARKKDGTELPVGVLFSTVLLQDEWSITGILRDNSKLKQDEIELLKYREQLEEMVMERTRELKEAQDELVNKAIDSGRVEISAMILHNIGNALTPVNVQVEELLQDEQKRLIDYMAKCHEDLKQNQNSLTEYVNETARGQEVFTFMGTLIQSMLEQVKDNQNAIHKIFSAVSYMAEIVSLQQSYATRGSETRQLVNLNLLLEDSIRMQQSSLEKRRITVEKDLTKNLPLLKIDKNKLMQVLVNLIKNSYEAIDSTNDPHTKKRIFLRTFKEKEQVCFEIADTGIGIEPDKIGSIFDFGESAKGSSGFGLYYSKMFVESNQGSLEFNSKGVGHGASVLVRFQQSEKSENPKEAS